MIKLKLKIALIWALLLFLACLFIVFILPYSIGAILAATLDKLSDKADKLACRHERLSKDIDEVFREHKRTW
jgi:hypothetical protein